MNRVYWISCPKHEDISDFQDFIEHERLKCSITTSLILKRNSYFNIATVPMKITITKLDEADVLKVAMFWKKKGKNINYKKGVEA